MRELPERLAHTSSGVFESKDPGAFVMHEVDTKLAWFDELMPRLFGRARS